MNSPASANPSARGLARFFEESARRFPERVAVECLDQHMSYAELDRWTNQLARALWRRGIQRGDRVALWMPRGIAFHAAILGVLKSGAAYVPLDAEYPRDRVEYIVENSQAKLVITVPEVFAEGNQIATAPVRFMADLQREAAQEDSRPIAADELQLAPGDEAYVIYTSGSTGRPKGVSIPHRAICHLVETEGKFFQLSPDDRVFQGFSLAFDASLEEIWLPFYAGGTLVIGTAEVVRLGNDLCEWLADQRITVFSTVPTQLLMLERDIPGIRILIVGGEACPASLINRWATPARRMFNTYGPTEATVIATWTEVKPQQPVTIGVPLPGYSAIILDDAGHRILGDQPGELCLGGKALANGYVGLPELTREKFILWPSEQLPQESLTESEISTGMARVYRTGDLCRWNSAGEIEFLGRIDGQVKLRGYRIELAEIEAVLVEHPTVSAAAVALRKDAADRPFLAAFIIARQGQSPEITAVKSFLRSRLATYMVPSTIVVLDELPRLPSGKIDRKQLPEVQDVIAAEDQIDAPSGPLPNDPWQAGLMKVWRELFATNAIRIDHHFFLDLGGDSLLAASLVSRLRKQPEYQQVSMRDVYQFPTIEQLANQLRSNRAAKSASSATPLTATRRENVVKHSTSRFAWCGVVQLMMLYVILGLGGLQWLAPYVTYSYLQDDGYEIVESLAWSVLALIAVYPVMLVVAILVKWLVLGRVKAGRYPLWGAFYLRWWFVRSIESLAPVHYLTGTPLLNWYCRLMGAKIGRNVYLGSDNIGTYDLLTIGAGTSINPDSSLIGYRISGGELLLGPVTIGDHCFLGARSVLSEDVRMESRARLDELSLLTPGMVVPAGETWGGSPAILRKQNSEAQLLPPLIVSRGQRFLFAVLQTLSVLCVPVLVVGALLPGMGLMHELNARDEWYWYLLLSPLVGLMFVVLLALEIAAFKWLLLGCVRPGTFPQHGFFALRKWWIDKLMELSLDVMGPVYSTLYLSPWYRLLGAQVGRRAEISTASFITPDLLFMGEESFIADIVSLGAMKVDGGRISIDRVEIGRRSFIGNSALLQPGTKIGENCLIGCLSVPPRETSPVPDGSSWAGSPAMFLPQRSVNQQFGEAATYTPPARMVALRAFIELFRIMLPSAGFICVASLMFSMVSILRDEIEPLLLLVILPILYGGACCLMTSCVILLKWVVIGRYRPLEAPLWSSFVWRSEFITALHDFFAVPAILDAIRGTPFLAWYMRMMGTKVGQRVFFDSPEISEFDLVEVGDDCEINSEATLQTHLFEDRVMKMSHVRLEAGCTVGSESLVLYDTRMQAGAELFELSLLMKGETLPPYSQWAGAPASQAN